jgi:Flp pilus assembly protein TadG
MNPRRRGCAALELARRLRREESGVALAELTLVLPLLLLLLFGMIDFGKAINYWIDETHLANEGARWAAVNKNPGALNYPDFQHYLLDQADTFEQKGTVVGTQRTPNTATVNVCYYRASDGSLTTTPAVGDTVEVLVRYDYRWLRGLPFGGANPTTTIGGKAAMRIEVTPDPAVINSANNTGGACPAAA